MLKLLTSSVSWIVPWGCSLIVFFCICLCHYLLVGWDMSPLIKHLKSHKFLFIHLWNPTCWQVLIENKGKQQTLNPNRKPSLAVVARLGHFREIGDGWRKNLRVFGWQNMKRLERLHLNHRKAQLVWAKNNYGVWAFQDNLREKWFKL